MTLNITDKVDGNVLSATELNSIQTPLEEDYNSFTYGKEQSVIYGCIATITGTSSTVDISAGKYIDYQGNIVSYAGGSTTLPAGASASNYRYDLLYINSLGALAFEQGTQGLEFDEDIALPSLPANGVPIALIKRSSASTAVQYHIVDQRIICSNVQDRIAAISSSVPTGAANMSQYVDLAIFLNKGYRSYKLEISFTGNLNSNNVNLKLNRDASGAGSYDTWWINAVTTTPTTGSNSSSAFPLDGIDSGSGYNGYQQTIVNITDILAPQSSTYYFQIMNFTTVSQSGSSSFRVGGGKRTTSNSGILSSLNISLPSPQNGDLVRHIVIYGLK